MDSPQTAASTTWLPSALLPHRRMLVTHFPRLRLRPPNHSLLLWARLRAAPRPRATRQEGLTLWAWVPLRNGGCSQAQSRVFTRSTRAVATMTRESFAHCIACVHSTRKLSRLSLIMSLVCTQPLPCCFLAHMLAQSLALGTCTSLRGRERTPPRGVERLLRAVTTAGPVGSGPCSPRSLPQETTGVLPHIGVAWRFGCSVQFA